RYARIALAEDGMNAVLPVDGRAAVAGPAFVARKCCVIEIVAARPLKQVSARCRHVAKLGARALKQRFCENGIRSDHASVGGEVAVFDQRSDAQAPARQGLDSRQRKLSYVDQPFGTLDAIAHEVHEVGAASKIARLRVASVFAQRFCDGIRADIGKWNHALPRRASSMAAQMPGYAPQRQMLPLIHSAIS